MCSILWDELTIIQCTHIQNLQSYYNESSTALEIAITNQEACLPTENLSNLKAYETQSWHTGIK